MEYVGLGMSLAGLFAMSLDVLDRISAAKSYGSDYHLFVTKVETELLRLFLWGQAVGLANGTSTMQNTKLEGPMVRQAVCELLAWTVYFFESSEVVKKRHRTESTRGFIALFPERRSRYSLSTAGVFEHPRGRAVEMQKNATGWRKMRWALSGKRKSEDLLRELGWLVEKLHELVPISDIQQDIFQLRAIGNI
ncbi:hypothetical protein K440DRAFT_158802 [Wilcoxina mikolae CBS 423.85]|nr:hypothetical protein K440DRAFT_158802 [Wilcoxina mikolae CBS 423.85]